MLYWLFYEHLKIEIFKFITPRLACAAITSFLISVLFGRRLIRFFKEMGVIENADRAPTEEVRRALERTDTPPTMGGIFVIVGVFLSTVLWAKLTVPAVMLALFVTLGLGLLGFADDAIKLFSTASDGLRGRTKILVQIVLAAVVAGILYQKFSSPGYGEYGTALVIPILRNPIPISMFFFIALTVLVIVGSSNAVNLTDGMDGLAAGTMMMAASTFVLLCYIAGHKGFASNFNILYIKGSGELAIFCTTLVGAMLGFLWFNCFPAEVFMGDTGSLALGGALGFVSVAIKQELLLVVVGGVFVAEALSVILQVASFKLTGKRILRCSPLHLHYRFAGMHQAKITLRFCIVAGMLAILSLLLLKFRQGLT